MQLLAKYIVPESNPNERLLDFAIREIKEITTRNGIKKAIKRGNLLLNGETSSTGTFLKANDIIELFQPELAIKKIFELKLEILFEDDYLAVVFKPAGIGVSGNYFKTIQNAIPFNLKPSTQPDKLDLPRPVHRLDNPTSGLLIIAKTHETVVKLGKMLEQKLIQKHYHALVVGIPENKNDIYTPINQQTAHTKLSIIKTIVSNKFKQLTLVKLSPITGRTHQLRIHMAQTGTPILGDKEYGNETTTMLKKGLFLSATELSFIHPITNTELTLKTEIPNKFKRLLQMV